MKIVVFVQCLATMVLFGCGDKQPKSIDPRFQGLEQILGNPVAVESMLDPLKKVYIYQYAEYKVEKPDDETLSKALKDWKLVDTRKDKETPFFWFNSSTWETFSKKSKNIEITRNEILDGEIQNASFFFKKSDNGVNRIIVIKRSKASTIVLMEGM
jgi:hypothetical protein